MIILKLQGGLGNQMFQYAAAKTHGSNSIYIDTDFLYTNNVSTSDFTKRELELSIFNNIDLKIANKFHKYLIKNNLLFNSKYIYQSEKNEFINFKVIKATHIYLDGYFQNEKYFSEIRDEILNDFKFPQLSESNQLIAKKINADHNSVAVHIRRGDYLKPSTNAYHGILPLEYYDLAKTQIEAKIHNPNYYIFSDDIEWCKSNLNFKNSSYISDKTANSWEDMHLMSMCRHNIIANSSYSWWSAWLNTNADKIVIAPKKWFVQQPTDIVPNQWIKV